MRARVLWLSLFLLTLVGSKLGAQSAKNQLPSTETVSQDSALPLLDSNTMSERQGEQESAHPADSPVSKTKEADQGRNDFQAPEKRKLRLRFGGLAVGAGYSHFSGPFYPYRYPYGSYGYYPGDWYGASFGSPIWSPYPFYGPGFFAYNSGRGELRLTTDPKLAEVYIDGGYAGTADRLKTLWLDPGAYDLTVSSAGREAFHQRVYVLSGKSLKIVAKLNPGEEKEKP